MSGNIISSIYPIIHSSICPIIHQSRHGLFSPTGRRKSEIQTRRDKQMYHQIHTHLCIRHGVQTCALSTGCIHLSIIHPSIRPVIHLSRHGLFTPTRWRKSGTSTHQRTSWSFCPWDGLYFFIQPQSLNFF